MRTVLLACFALLLLPGQGIASICHAFAERGTQVAGIGPVAWEAPVVDIIFVGHSTFRIETPEGVVINTDYNGANGPGGLPDVVTMNHAHGTHYTDNPDPGIEHVLRGWNPSGDGPAEHRLEVGDVTIRNVTTDIRRFGGEKDGNSIFVFEVADLCIAHLGHLHHPLDDGHYAALGRIDVLMVPVDGTYTMAVGEMVEIAKRLKSSIVLTMHAFGRSSLQRFVAGMADSFAVREHPADVLPVSIETLPAEPTVVVMPPARYKRREDLRWPG